MLYIEVLACNQYPSKCMTTPGFHTESGPRIPPLPHSPQKCPILLVGALETQ